MKVRRTPSHPFEMRRKSGLHILGIPSSRTEVADIVKAWFVISFIFAMLNFRRGMGVNLFALLFTTGFIREFVIAGITVGVGFLLHELAHKIMAQRYGCMAEFRSDDMMLIVAMVMAFFLGFVFIAPGATMIAGRVRPEQSGKIALAGPLVNLLIAVSFLALIFVPLPAASEIALKGYFINVFLATFNMIPFWFFDGKKVWTWNRGIWLGMIVVCIAMMVPFFIG
ncbi:MAG: hypothetical protein AABX51_03950 [Nanoarchaeota archaeon]